MSDPRDRRLQCRKRLLGSIAASTAAPAINVDADAVPVGLKPSGRRDAAEPPMESASVLTW